MTRSSHLPVTQPLDGTMITTGSRSFSAIAALKTAMICTYVLGTGVRLAYVGRSTGHEHFHGGRYEDPYKTLC